ncbi:MAG: hypothetical protein ACRENC_04095, partial [Gemmatimonadaceae bacterium]
MTLPALDRLRRGGERFMEELSREYYQAHAGLKAAAELQPIYARHADLFADDGFHLVLDAFRDAAPGSQSARSARLMLEWQAESRVSRALAPMEEREIAWEAGAVATLSDGRQVPYQRLAIDIANATEHAERLLLEQGRATLVRAELAPMRREHLQRERDLVDGLGIAPTYNGTFSLVSGVELAPLVAQCESFLRDTQSMWDDVVASTVRDRLGID